MKLNKNQLQFIIDNDVEEMVFLLQEEFSIDIISAFDYVYNSNLYQKLINTKTGLYLQSPEYQYNYLKEELLSSNRFNILKENAN